MGKIYNLKFVRIVAWLMAIMGIIFFLSALGASLIKEFPIYFSSSRIVTSIIYFLWGSLFIFFLSSILKSRIWSWLGSVILVFLTYLLLTAKFLFDLFSSIWTMFSPTEEQILFFRIFLIINSLIFLFFVFLLTKKNKYSKSIQPNFVPPSSKNFSLTSFFLGIFSLLIGPGVVYFPIFRFPIEFLLVLLPISAVLALVGLVAGFIGSRFKLISILGIILCSIDIICIVMMFI
ncbi:MAG: hypothetical protein V1858_04530 [Candidatus Gottesmanbacteria bacterium]